MSTVRIKHSLSRSYTWLVEYQDGQVWRLAGWITKATDGSWLATRGFFGATERLGPFRLQREAKAALVEKAMASGDKPGAERRAA